ADKSRQERAWSSAKLEAAQLIMRAARLREDRIDGMRAELAATLVNGAPCPVCGSLDHPELCELQGERVTREQEEAADAEAATATERAESTGTRLRAADERVHVLPDRRAGGHRESLLAQLGGHPDLDTALTAARQAADALTAAADAADATRRAEDDTRRACDLAVQAAAEAGFADLEAARRAQRDAP